MNSDCAFIKRGDHADCFNAAGGRGAEDDWCASCLLLRIARAERAVATMASWLVQVQTGFGVQDERGIDKILSEPRATSGPGPWFADSGDTSLTGARWPVGGGDAT